MGVLHVTLLLGATLQAQSAQDPAAVVRQALVAVEADSATVLEQRWSSVYARDPHDRSTTLGLATLAHLTYRDSVAQRHYRALLNGPADLTAGYASLGLAGIVAERENWQSADSAIRVALKTARATRDSSFLAEALALHARIRLNTLNPDSAKKTIAEAAAVWPARDARVGALIRLAQGRILAAQGDARGALSHFLGGAQLAQRSGAARIEAVCYFDAANEYGRLFRNDSSMLAYERAIQGFRRTRDQSNLANALRWRADVFRLYGDLGRARRDADESILAALASRRLGLLPWAHLLRAQVAMAFGDLRGAATDAAAASRTFAAVNDSIGQVVTPVLEANLALAQGDAQSARAAFQTAAHQARLHWRIAGASAWSGRAWAEVLAGDSAAARKAVDSTRVFMRGQGMSEHGSSLSLLEGTIALRWNRLKDAERIFRARLAAQTPNQGIRYYVTAARLAEVLMREGRLHAADSLLHAATEQFDSWRQSVNDRQLRLLAFQLASDMSDPDLGVATVIAAMVRDGRIASAFDLVERGRARELADRLTRALAMDTTGTAGVARSGRSVSLERLMRSLPDDSTALLEYVTGRGDPTTLFVITRRDASVYLLASQDSLARPIARLSALLESGDDPRTLGRDLATKVFGRALIELEPAVKRLIIVPDGPLLRLPFDVLVQENGSFLLERFSVNTVPAASVAVQLWERQNKAASARLAVFADPRFAQETNSGATVETFRSAVVGAEGLPRLRGSALEARTVARYADQATVLRRNRASESWLKSAQLEQYAVVHFATHALVDEGSLSNTALALAPGGNEDGFLHSGELANLKLNAELVILSACRTAGGAIVRGEGVQGLAAPLLAAGARAIAATWWPIGDVATLRLVDDFYSAMADGMNAGDALHSAKLAAFQRGVPPREWAAFTLVGDPFARPPLRPASLLSPTWRWPALAVFAAAVIYGLVMRRRRVRAARVPSGRTATTHQR